MPVPSVHQGTSSPAMSRVSAVKAAMASDMMRRGRTRRDFSRLSDSHASMSAVAAALASTGRASVSATHLPQRTINRPAPRGDCLSSRAR